MRISELFTVPKGKKITEKMMARVLISSICSILLCMVCLAGTTWAWFAVSIENPGNEIQISSVTITEQINNIARDPKKSYDLPKGTYKVKASVTNNATESQRPVYVNMMVAYKSTAEPDRVIRSECYSFKFEYRQSLKTWEQDKIIAEIDVVEGCFATVSFWPSWTGQSEHIYEGNAKAEIKSPDGITVEEPAEPPMKGPQPNADETKPTGEPENTGSEGTESAEGTAPSTSEAEPSGDGTTQTGSDDTTSADSSATDPTTEPPTEVETTASTDPATDPTNDAGTTPSTEGITEPDETVTPTTEAPSDATTEAPSDATTEAPSDATTEAPSDATTEAPIDATTAPTTEVVTEEPTSTESVD